MHRILAVGSLGLLLVACSRLPGALNAGLDGEWQLQAGTNQGAAIPIAAAHPITLKVDGTQVGGSAACNQYGGKLEISGTTIKVTDLIQTEMACIDDGAMASEAAYLAALPLVDTAAHDGDSVVLSGPGVELRFALVPPVPNADLVGPAWTLVSLISGQVASSLTADPATLQLNANGTLAASTGCRNVTGHYTVSGSTVKLTLDPYDLIACTDPLGAQDSQVLRVLGGADGFTVAIQGNSMTLTARAQGLGYRVVAAGS
jgi:heat shock protein HslJ